MPFPGDGFYDAANSFSSLSISDGTTQTGSFTNVTDYGWLSLVVTRDNTAGPGDTVQVSWSVDGTNEFVADTLTLTSDRGEQTIPAYLPYVRIIYTNNSGQTASVSIALTIRPGVGPVGISSGFASTNAYTKGLVGVPVSGIRNESSGAFTTSDGNFSPLAVDRSGRVFIVPQLLSAQDTRLYLDGSVGGYASAPDAAALQISGDIDIRAAIQNSSGPSQFICSKRADYFHGYGLYRTAAPSTSYLVFVYGTGSTQVSAESTVALPTATPLLVRVTRASATGTVTFYTKSYVSGTVGSDLASNTGWTALGSTRSTASGSLATDSSALRIGADAPTSPLDYFSGAIYGINIRNAIGGAGEVANPDWSTATIGASSLADGHSNTFTNNGTAVIVGNQYLSVPADPNGAMQVSVDNGYVGGYTVKTANLDGDTTNGNKQLVAAVTGKRIRVLSYMVNQAAGGAGTTKFNDASGGTVLCTAALGATSTQTEAAPAGSFLFQTTAGNALFLNTNSANARSVRVTYVEV